VGFILTKNKFIQLNVGAKSVAYFYGMFKDIKFKVLTFLAIYFITIA